MNLFAFKIEAIIQYKDLVDGEYLVSVLKAAFKQDPDLSSNDSLMEIYCKALKTPADHRYFQHFLFPEMLLTFKTSPFLVSEGTTGKRLWDASLALTEYFYTNPHIVKDKRILELGTGTGFCGISLAKLLNPKRVILSDLEQVSENVTAHNIDLNNAKAEFITLDWETDSFDFSSIDSIVGSDLVYDPNLGSILAKFILNALDQNPDLEIYIMQGIRSKETFDQFVALLPDSFTVSSVSLNSNLFYYRDVIQGMKLIKYPNKSIY